MPVLLDDCRLRRVVCELRYENAYLIFDRTGQIIEEVREKFTKVELQEASPAITRVQTAEGYLVLELGQARIVKDFPPLDLALFANACKSFLLMGAERLNIPAFTRVGLRQIFSKKVPEMKDAEKFITEYGLLNVPEAIRFGASDKLNEFVVRWQGSETGATLRLKAEFSRLEVSLPGETEDEDLKLEREANTLVIDVDYYTVARVNRDQWDPTAWIPQSGRIVRKEVDRFLQRS